MFTIKQRFCSVFGLLLCVIALGVSPAFAALIATGLDCDNNSATTLMDPDALDCSGAWEGNDANQQTDVLAELGSAFGMDGMWFLADKVDVEDDGTSGPGGPFIESIVGFSAGTITFVDPIPGKFAIALKSDDAFSLYLYDGGNAGIGSIDYVTDGVSVNTNRQFLNLEICLTARFILSRSRRP